MFNRNLVRFVYLLLVGILLIGCVPASQSNTPVESPSDGSNPSQGAYPPATSKVPPDSVVTSPPYPQPVEPQMPDWQPVPEDQTLERGEAFIDEIQSLVLESFPPQFKLYIKGSLPNPCHKLRVQIAAPDTQKRILVKVYSVFDPQMICIEMLQAFDISVTIPNPPSGENYTLWVNGKQAGEIEW